MKKEQAFLISFGGLSLGKHQFQFSVNQQLFEEFDYAEAEDLNAIVVVELEKQETMIAFDFSIKGTVSICCDRCCEYYKQPIEGTYSLYIKFGEEYFEESEDVIVIPFKQQQFDFMQLIYEYIVLLLPLKRLHPNDKNKRSTCNKEMIKKLQELEIQENIDYRWDKLRQLDTE